MSIKKLLSSLTAAFFVMCANIPFVFALDPPDQPDQLPATENFGEALTTVINWFLTLVGAFALLMLVIGGFRYLISGGNQEAVEKAKNTITYAIIGIIIIILSYAIVYTITEVLGG